MEIKTWRDPYDSGFSPTKPTKIELEPGLTVLVGCNGAGKTTLLNNINDEMKNANIPCHFYNNLNEGGSSSISSTLFLGNTELAVSLWTASEGEAIKINFGQLSTKFDRFLEEGFFDTQKNRLANIFRQYNGSEELKIATNKRVLLFDAVDSGLSVDSIVELKMVFEEVLKKAEEYNIELYLVISANEYELARKSRCFDVNSGTYVEFENYESYRKFILKSRERKEKRIQKQAIWFENKRRREAEAKIKREAKYRPLIEEIENKAKAENRELSWSEKDKIYRYNAIIDGKRY